MSTIIETRRFGLALLMLAGASWAGVVSLAGLWLLFGAAGRWPGASSPLILAGVSFLAMGQFIFSYFVADRLFPGFGRRVGWWIEAGAIMVFVPTFGVAIGGLITGAWP